VKYHFSHWASCCTETKILFFVEENFSFDFKEMNNSILDSIIAIEGNSDHIEQIIHVRPFACQFDGTFWWFHGKIHQYVVTISAAIY